MNGIIKEYHNIKINSFDILLNDYYPGQILYPSSIGFDSCDSPESSILNFSVCCSAINDTFFLFDDYVDDGDINALNNISYSKEVLNLNTAGYFYTTYVVENSDIKYLFYSQEAKEGLIEFLRQCGCQSDLLSSIKGVVTLMKKNNKHGGDLILLLDRDFNISYDLPLLTFNGSIFKYNNTNIDLSEYGFNESNILINFHRISLIWYSLKRLELLTNNLEYSLKVASDFIHSIYYGSFYSDDIYVNNICNFLCKNKYTFVWNDSITKLTRQKWVYAVYNLIIRNGISGCVGLYRTGDFKQLEKCLERSFAFMLGNTKFLFKDSETNTFIEICNLCLFVICFGSFIPSVSPMISPWIYMGIYKLIETSSFKSHMLLRCLMAFNLYHNSTSFSRFISFLDQKQASNNDYFNHKIIELISYFYDIDTPTEGYAWDALGDKEKIFIGGLCNIKSFYQDIQGNQRFSNSALFNKNSTTPLFAKQLFDVIIEQYNIDSHFGLEP
ncbi:MAG: hypothetical protein HDS59_00570 [Barnesiella sp.]|nr:hypothetical protein [Barnesiella sp.]